MENKEVDKLFRGCEHDGSFVSIGEIRRIVSPVLKELSEQRARAEKAEAKLEEVRTEILKHCTCKTYHNIEGKKATCLDVVLLNCFNLPKEGGENGTKN